MSIDRAAGQEPLLPFHPRWATLRAAQVASISTATQGGQGPATQVAE
jgi:hypothetical protein